MAGAQEPGSRLQHEQQQLDRAHRQRRRRLVRAVVQVAVFVAVVVFVVQNDASVPVHFWGVVRHPRLIWVIVGCLAIGAVFGYLAGRPGRRPGSWRQRRRARRQPAP